MDHDIFSTSSQWIWLYSVTPLLLFCPCSPQHQLCSPSARSFENHAFSSRVIHCAWCLWSFQLRLLICAFIHTLIFVCVYAHCAGLMLRTICFFFWYLFSSSLGLHLHFSCNIPVSFESVPFSAEYSGIFLLLEWRLSVYIAYLLMGDLFCNPNPYIQPLYA